MDIGIFFIWLQLFLPCIAKSSFQLEMPFAGQSLLTLGKWLKDAKHWVTGFMAGKSIHPSTMEIKFGGGAELIRDKHCCSCQLQAFVVRTYQLSASFFCWKDETLGRRNRGVKLRYGLWTVMVRKLWVRVWTANLLVTPGMRSFSTSDLA